MTQRYHHFKPQESKPDPMLIAHQRGDKLSKADFGVRNGWKKFPKWLEMWLVHHHQDWFDAIDSLTKMLSIGEYEK